MLEIKKLDKIPAGWVFAKENPNCAPKGYVLATNGESLFSGKYEHAWIKDPRGILLQKAAREQMKLKLLADIRQDICVCELEGTDYKEYLNEIKEIVDSFLKGKNTND